MLLLAVLLLEPFGLRWKTQFLRRRNVEEGAGPQGSMMAIFSVAAIGHVLVTMFLAMAMLDCWGAVGAGSEASSPWWGAVIVALILKEFLGLGAMGGRSVAREAPGHGKERLADFFLLAFGCVAYTAWWSAIIDLEEISGLGIWERAALLPILGALFAFVYLPMRVPFLLEEYYLHPAQGRTFRLFAELAFGVLLGLYPVFA